MSFSSLEAGHGTSSGAALYPLRTLARDLLEREVQRELEAWLNRVDGQSTSPDQTDDDLASWLRSDDSPLLIHNVEEFVLDPDAHLRAVASQVEGLGRAQHFLRGEITGVNPRGNLRDRAEELRARLRTVAKLDAERILAVPRRRGTPRGKTRTHYLLLVSPDRDISNADFKRLVREIISRRWPGAVACGYIHRDTDNTHLHIWVSAETLSGKKISVTRATPSGDAILDKYPDVDEEVARAVSRHFNDPSIYDDHIARKLEWVHWRERFEESLRRGECPPVMPHRARHDYDWVGERRAVSDREQGESRSHSVEREKAAPVPRVKSLMGALELWGKTVYLDAKVKYRRALLDSLDVWRDQIDYAVEGMRQSLELKLEEAERDYERHRDAFEKTLENRARQEYPELKYPLHNSKQIAEMAEIARLTRDAALLSYVRSYTDLDKPTDRKGQVREVGSRWRDHIEARLEVLERAEMFVQVAGRRDVSSAIVQAGTASDTGRSPFDRDQEIVRGWLDSGWTTEQMRESLPCFETEVVRLHAARYLEAREFFVAAGEALAEWREGGMRLAVRPALEVSDLNRIDRLVSGEGSCIGERESALLLDLAASARLEREASSRETSRLLELSFKIDVGRRGEVNHPSGKQGDWEVFRPHHNNWAGRLAGLLTRRETEVLALAVTGASRERFEALREDVYVNRELMELTRAVRAASGMAHDVPAGMSNAEERTLDRHLQAIANGLRSRGEGWEEWQATGVGEFKHILPVRERERAGRVVEEARARLKDERRAEALERLEPQLESAAQFYVRAAYRDEGLVVMREPTHLNDHVQRLAERFSQVARDAGHEPEHLGLIEKELEARAERILSEAVERFGREECDSYELGRLEARMILACAVRDEAAMHQQRFADHAHFHEWSYETNNGPGRTSLAQIWLTYNDETDPAVILVAQDAEPHVVRSSNQVQTRLFEEGCVRAEEVEVVTRQYESMVEGLGRRGITPRDPVFSSDEITRLEEAAVAMRDHELIGLVARFEAEQFGPEYAARRALGRALSAAAILDVEYKLPARFERPVAQQRLSTLPPQVRENLSALLDRHHEARRGEQSAAFSFHSELNRAAEIWAGNFPRVGPGSIRPLLSTKEAGEIFGAMVTMGQHDRLVWDKRTRGAEVAVPGLNANGGLKRGPALGEWGAKNPQDVYRHRSEYERGISGEKVMSYRAAQAIIREQSRNQAQQRAPFPNR
ncbi:MAG TPA: hypothetical protein VGN95_14115 [Pyrinomonadaceae bacterium]|nr:hypothetical protein [Pyrinomonadaceae bacterium]